MNVNEIPTGDPAKVFTGIRDVPIYAGESSSGNRLPGGPYRIPEVIAIASIMLPALWWFKADPDNGFGVLVGAAALALAVTIVLRIALPKQRPSLATRTRFMLASLLPRQQCAAPPQTRSGDVPQR